MNLPCATSTLDRTPGDIMPGIPEGGEVEEVRDWLLGWGLGGQAKAGADESERGWVVVSVEDTNKESFVGQKTDQESQGWESVEEVDVGTSTCHPSSPFSPVQLIVILIAQINSNSSFFTLILCPTLP